MLPPAASPSSLSPRQSNETFERVSKSRQHLASTRDLLRIELLAPSSSLLQERIIALHVPESLIASHCTQDIILKVFKSSPGFTHSLGHYVANTSGLRQIVSNVLETNAMLSWHASYQRAKHFGPLLYATIGAYPARYARQCLLSATYHARRVTGVHMRREAVTRPCF